MALKALPSPEVLRQLLRYEPDTGKLFWLPRPLTMFRDTEGKTAANACGIWNARFAGQEAFITPSSKGYLRGQLFGETTFAHRIIWAIFHAAHPEGFIDHIDHNRQNNRIENLRVVASCVENGRNMTRSRANKSGHTGVAWHQSAEKWEAYIMVKGKKKYLGLFGAFTDAVAARRQANETNGFHENHGASA